MDGEIYKKMAQIMKETTAISKGQKNLQQGFMYRGIDDIMNSLHELFANNDVFIIPTVLEYSVTEKTNAKGTLLFYTRTKASFKFITTDGSFVECVNVGEAMDSGDKGMAKTMSIALKYALLQSLLIPTKEEKDSDAKAYNDVKNKSSDDGLDIALQEIKEASSTNDLAQIWGRWTGFQSNRVFVEKISARKKELC